MKLIIEAHALGCEQYQFKIIHKGGVDESFEFKRVPLPFSEELIREHLKLFIQVLKEGDGIKESV